LSVGDAHAWQPHGELTAVDVPVTVTRVVNLVKVFYPPTSVSLFRSLKYMSAG